LNQGQNIIVPREDYETNLYARNSTGLNQPLEEWLGTSSLVTSIKTNTQTPIFPPADLCRFVGKMTEASMVNDGQRWSKNSHTGIEKVFYILTRGIGKTLSQRIKSIVPSVK
jgi:hypothetical protein